MKLESAEREVDGGLESVGGTKVIRKCNSFCVRHLLRTTSPRSGARAMPRSPIERDRVMRAEVDGPRGG